MTTDRARAGELLRSVLGGMKAGLFAIDSDARLTAFTPRAERLTGFTREEVLGRKCFEVLATDHCDDCPVKRTGQVPREVLDYELEATAKTGARLPLDVTISPLRSQDASPVGAVGILRDMTEQKRLWQNLRQERDRARRYLSIARVTIVALDALGRITLVNEKGSEILGYESEELLGQDWFALCVPERSREELRQGFSRLMSGLNQTGSRRENSVVTKTGAERLIAWRHTTLRDDEGRITGLLSSGEDVTDRKKAEAELIRSEKLAAIGQLAAGVAHEVNNPLAGLLVYFKVLLKKYREGTLQIEETEQQLLKMERETARSSRIIKDLLDFSRQAKPALRPIDVNEVVDATLSIVGHQITLANIELVKNLGAELPPVVADFDQIQQAMMNTVLNAVQAMPEGGRLTISTASVDGVELNGTLRSTVRVDITDTGGGIPEENLDRVFTPFFSTKTKGKGVGLGLSTVQGIIERHKGRIEIDSRIERGTTFTLWLEATDGSQAENPDR